MAGESELFLAKVAYLVTFLLGFTINLILILVVIFTKPRRRSNKISRTVFIAHLAFVSICLAFGLLINTSTLYFLIPVPPTLCRPVAYIKNVLMCAYPVNIVVVIRDRMQLVQLNKEKCYWVVRVLFIWAVSLVFNIPAAFLIESRKTRENGKCVTVNLFGSFAVTATYEVLKYSLFYLLVILDMIRITRNVRRKLAVVNNLDAKTRQYKRSIRLLYFHLFTFTVYWLPGGFYSGYKKLILRYKHDISEDSIDYQKSWNPFGVYFGLVLYSYSLLVPLFSYLLFESKPKLAPSQLCICKRPETSVSTISLGRQQSMDRHGLTTCQHSLASHHLKNEREEQVVEIHFPTKTVRWNVASLKAKVELGESGTHSMLRKGSTSCVYEVNVPLKEQLI